MYSKYGITSKSNVKLSKLVKLLIDADETEKEQRIWELWKSLYPNMNKDNFIDFGDFKEKLVKKNFSEKSYKEIEAEMNKVVEAYERQVK